MWESNKSGIVGAGVMDGSRQSARSDLTIVLASLSKCWMAPVSSSSPGPSGRE